MLEQGVRKDHRWDFPAVLRKRRENTKKDVLGKRAAGSHCREMYIAYSSLQRQHGTQQTKKIIAQTTEKKGGAGNGGMFCAKN